MIPRRTSLAGIKRSIFIVPFKNQYHCDPVRYVSILGPVTIMTWRALQKQTWKCSDRATSTWFDL